MCVIFQTTFHCKVWTWDMASVKYTCRPVWEVFEQVPGFSSSLLSNILSYAQNWAGSIRCYHPPPATYPCWASQTQESLPWTSQSIAYSESAFTGFHKISWMSIKCRTWARRACKRSPGLHQRRGKQSVHNGGSKRSMGLISIFIGFWGVLWLTRPWVLNMSPSSS